MINDIPAIKVFACDYRKIKDKWNLPFIRLGDSHSDAIINIGNDIENNKYMPALSELDKIWWVSKHIEEFGKTDYVGFCHYRRFFSFGLNKAVVDIKADQFKPELIITPEQELSLILQNGCVGCSMQPLNVTPPNGMKIWEQIEYLDGTMKADICKKLFEIFLSHSPDNLRSHIENAFSEQREYLCNIFTLRKDLFLELSSMMFPTLVEFNDVVSPDIRKKWHPRYLGYFAERLISVYLHAIQRSGMKLLHLPLLTIDCWRHNKVIEDKDGNKIEVLD